MKNIWNTYKSSFLLLAAMIIGGVVGMFWGEGASVLQPVADIFLNLLYCCVVPLIFCSLTSAIAKMEDLTKLRKILITFLVGTIVSGVIACLFMVIPSLIFDPGKGAVLDLTEDVADATGSLNILGMFTVNDFPLLFSPQLPEKLAQDMRLLFPVYRFLESTAQEVLRRETEQGLWQR